MISEPTGPDNHSKIDFVVHTTAYKNSPSAGQLPRGYYKGNRPSLLGANNQSLASTDGPDEVAANLCAVGSVAIAHVHLKGRVSIKEDASR